MKKLTGFIAALLLLTFVTSCKKEHDPDNTVPPANQNGTVEIEFEHTFGTTDFTLGTAFTTQTAEQLTFTKVKYYISNIILQKTDNTYWNVPDSYYLIDASIANGNVLSIANVPAAEYKSVSYTIGVDSARNVAGTQTGALDPANNMFWSWNSGYIFMKFEGTSPQAAGNKFEYHVGGFSGANNALQQNSHSFGSTNLIVKGNGTSKIHLAANLQKVFDGEHSTIKVADVSTTHMPGPLAVEIAENFSHAIEFEHVHNN
jgi:hypothetical protein